jgi:CRISPR-associated protein Csx14
MSVSNLHILLALCGLAPQVITEALYALHQENQLPDKMYILTTRQGRDACLSGLFAPEDGALGRFCTDYACAIDCSPEDILMCRREDRSGVNDILSAADHNAFLHLCMKQAQALTSNPDNRVSFLIAGGRKTMSACLSTAASCYGRTQDQLLHVLVSPGFEQNREFFYPPPKPRWINSFTNTNTPCRLNTDDAQIQLIRLPLVSLRRQLPDNPEENPPSPDELLHSICAVKNDLQVDMQTAEVSWQGKSVTLPPSIMALYVFFLRHKIQQPCQKGTCTTQCNQCFLHSSEILHQSTHIAEIYTQLRPKSNPNTSGIQQLDLENFNTYRCRLNRRLKQAFGTSAAKLLGISASGKRPGRQYGVTLSKDRIEIQE